MKKSSSWETSDEKKKEEPFLCADECRWFLNIDRKERPPLDGDPNRLKSR